MPDRILIIVGHTIGRTISLLLVATRIDENDTWSNPLLQFFHAKQRFGSFCFQYSLLLFAHRRYV